MSKGVINLIHRKWDGFVTVTPARWLGDAFHEYRRAIDGALYDAPRKLFYIRHDQVLDVVTRLEEAAFEVKLYGDPLIKTLAHAIENRKGRAIDAAKAIEEIDAKLKERGLSLFDFQRRDVEFLVSRERVLNANEQGLGKTVETIASLPYGAAVLVVCPKEARHVWPRELERFRGDEFVAIEIKKRADFRLPAAHEMIVCNFDLLPPKDAVLVAPAPLFLVCDEIHKLANAKTNRTQSWTAIRDGAPAERVVGLSGTPLPTDPLDLWGVLSAVGVEREVFGSFTRFAELFYGRKRYFWAGRTRRGAGWVFGVCPDRGREAEDKLAVNVDTLIAPHTCETCKGEPMTPSPEIAKMLSRVMIRHEKKDVLKDLPEKIYQVIQVPPSAKVKATLDRMDLAPVLVAETLDQVQESAPLMTARRMIAEAKIAYAEDILDEWEAEGHAALAFSAHRLPVERIGQRLGWSAIIGDMAEDRRAVEADFQCGKTRGVALTIQAGSTALTLTRASRVLFIDRAWNPSDNDQAEDRAHRIGQTAGLVIVDLVLDHPVDRHVHVLNMRKRAIIRATVGRVVGDRDVKLPLIKAMRRAGGS